MEIGDMIYCSPMSSYLSTISWDQGIVIKRRNAPILGMLFDELGHQILALGTFDVDNLDTSLLEVFFAAYEGVVLAEDNSLDLV